MLVMSSALRQSSSGDEDIEFEELPHCFTPQCIYTIIPTMFMLEVSFSHEGQQMLQKDWIQKRSAKAIGLQEPRRAF